MFICLYIFMCDNNEIRGQEVYRRVWKKERKKRDVAIIL